MAAQRGQCEAGPASDWTDAAGVNIFPYLGSWILHSPGRLSVLPKRVISADGKLLKCPEGSSSSVPLKRGGVSVIWFTGVWKAPNYLQVFQFYFACTDVLGYVLEVSTPYGVQVFKIGKSVPRATGGVEPLARELLQPLQMEALGLSRLWAAATDYFLWSLAPHLPAVRSSYCTNEILFRDFIF